MTQRIDISQCSTTEHFQAWARQEKNDSAIKIQTTYKSSLPKLQDKRMDKLERRCFEEASLLPNDPVRTRGSRINKLYTAQKPNSPLEQNKSTRAAERTKPKDKVEKQPKTVSFKMNSRLGKSSAVKIQALGRGFLVRKGLKEAKAIVSKAAAREAQVRNTMSSSPGMGQFRASLIMGAAYAGKDHIDPLMNQAGELLTKGQAMAGPLLDKASKAAKPLIEQGTDAIGKGASSLAELATKENAISMGATLLKGISNLADRVGKNPKIALPVAAFAFTVFGFRAYAQMSKKPEQPKPEQPKPEEKLSGIGLMNMKA